MSGGENWLRALREQLEGAPLVVLGVHDGISMRIAARYGFRAAWAGTFGVLGSQALPDTGDLSPREYLDRLAEICGAGCIPVLVDVDCGLAAEDPDWLIQSLKRAGARGLALEDKTLPKSNSFSSEKHFLVEPALMTARLRAMRNAVAENVDFALLARTDGLVCNLSIHDLVDRLKAYANEGLDGVLVQSVDPSPAKLLRACEATRREFGDLTLGVIPTAYPDVPLEAWRSAGVDVVILANHLLRAAVFAMCELAIDARTDVCGLDGLTTMSKIFKLTSAADDL